MVASRASVMHGSGKTSGGLSDKDLKYNKKGEIVSKQKSKDAKANPWIKAVMKARKEMIKDGSIKKGEFAPVKGALLTKAREIYKK
jgi:hypothetical protein